MDASSSKRAPIAKKGYGLQLRDGNMPTRFCNRLGCHGRLNHTEVPTIARTSKNVHASSGKTIVRSSTRTSSIKTSSKKEASEASSSQSKPAKSELCSAEATKAEFPTIARTSKNVHASSGKTIVRSSTRTSSIKTSSRKEASETSSSQSKPAKSELCSAEAIKAEFHSQSNISSSQDEPNMPEIGSAETTQAEFQSQSNISSSRKIRMGKVVGSSSASSSVRPHKVSIQRSGQRNQENSSGLSASLVSKSSLSCKEPVNNNARMYSLRNASTSYTNLRRNKDITKKQNPSAIETKINLRGKEVSRPTTEGGRGSVRVPSNGISISDSRRQPWSRSNSNNRASTIPSRKPVPRTYYSFISGKPIPRSYYSFTSCPIIRESSSRTDRSPPSTGSEVPWGWGDENLGQDEGMIQQPQLNTEQQFFQDGMGIYDQYRDMRLDVDNMSYEELLALGERIGNVSTGIDEEHKWKYVCRRIYDHTSSSAETVVDHDDIQCSICQEEYTNGDEMGLLNCNHSYHFTCIDEWLGRKKSCPICTVEAAPIGSSSSSSSN